jgi:uncharacterized protein
VFVESIAFFTAAGIGLVASIIGMGGGFLYVPTLAFLFGLDYRMAIGTSLAAMVFSAGTATLVYRQQQKVIGQLALLLVLPAMCFSALGSLLTVWFDERLLIVIFALVLLIMSLQMLLPSRSFVPVIPWGPSFEVTLSAPGDQVGPVRVPCLHLVVWGAMGGLVSGITGTSGGAFFVPALVVTGIPVHFAVATSLLAIIPTALTGAAAHAAIGNVSLPFLLLYGAGAAIGAYCGASIAPRIRAGYIQRGFGVLLILVALMMIQQKVLGG